MEVDLIISGVLFVALSTYIWLHIIDFIVLKRKAKRYRKIALDVAQQLRKKGYTNSATCIYNEVEKLDEAFLTRHIPKQ